jgi:hypothetical protein
MRINVYKPGAVIIKKSHNGTLPTNQKVVVVIEGAIKKSKNINLAAVRSQIFGEEFLLSTKIKGKYDDDIVMQGTGVLGEIKAELIKDIIGGHIDTVAEERERLVNAELEAVLEYRKKELIEGLGQLLIIKELRQGEFGPAFLVSCDR